MQKIRSKLPIIIIALIAFGIIAITYFAGQKAGVIKTGTPPVPQSTTVSGVNVRNFEANPVLKNTENDSLIIDNNDYQIAYVKQYNQFLITINNKDFEATRKIAEDAFITNLKISKTDACKLKVSISTPAFVNQDLSGQEFPLSFCK